MASGQLFWTAYFPDGIKIQQMTLEAERSLLSIDTVGMKRFLLHNINNVRIFELNLTPTEDRLIFRRRVILQYGSGSGDDGMTVEGKQVYYMVGKQNVRTRKVWIDVLNDYGWMVCSADGFVPEHPLLSAPEFLPQEGIVIGEPRCPTAACPTVSR